MFARAKASAQEYLISELKVPREIVLENIDSMTNAEYRAYLLKVMPSIIVPPAPPEVGAIDVPIEIQQEADGFVAEDPNDEDQVAEAQAAQDEFLAIKRLEIWEALTQAQDENEMQKTEQRVGKGVHQAQGFRRGQRVAHQALARR
jgi:hypothetical protein